MNGILVINKDKGYTSHDAVAVIKRLTQEKHLGHTGTLDPNATGVLPICLGYCTRLIEYIDNVPKEYVAEAKLGIRTDTQDIWGNVIQEQNVAEISENDILNIIDHYVGDINQVPSIYSSVRVNGRHLYSYAHSGETVDIPSREVKVFSIDLLNFDPLEGTFSIKVSCGRGTYIRTIISDIGDELGCGACMTFLVRTSACGFDIRDSVSLEELKEMSPEEIESHIHPAESAVSSMNRVDIDESQKIDFANGKHLKAAQNNMSSEAPVCIFYNGELCGIGKWDNPNRIKPEKVFIR